MSTARRASRPLFLSLLAAFRVRTHICLLLVILPPNAGACMAWLYRFHPRNNVTLGLPPLLIGARIGWRVADAVPPCHE